MNGLFSDTVISYDHVPHPIDLSPIHIVVSGVMDSDTPIGEYLYYELKDTGGKCFNPEEPFDHIPTRVEVVELMIVKYVRQHPEFLYNLTRNC